MVELATLLEEIALSSPGSVGVAPPEMPEATDDSEGGVGITGYELDDSDWEALQIVADGRGASLDPLSTDWLREVGLIEQDEGGPARLSQFGVEWTGWRA